jgi:hypothetical protein
MTVVVVVVVVVAALSVAVVEIRAVVSVEIGWVIVLTVVIAAMLVGEVSETPTTMCVILVPQILHCDQLAPFFVILPPPTPSFLTAARQPVSRISITTATFVAQPLPDFLPLPLLSTPPLTSIQIDPGKELFALGMANIVGSFFGPHFCCCCARPVYRLAFIPFGLTVFSRT